MLTHEIERMTRKGQPAPLLNDQQHNWLWMLFENMGAGCTDACRNHPRHGNTVKALLQLAHALHAHDEAERVASIGTAIAYAQDALSGKPPKHHLQEAREAVDAKTAELIRGFRALRAPLPRALEKQES